MIDQIIRFPGYLKLKNTRAINRGLLKIADCIRQQEKVLRRISEGMDPAVYFKTFRPYIRFFENVSYQGTDLKPLNYRGETGAQSSIMPTLVALMKIPHKPSILTNHLSDMRRYMPAPHREFIQWVEAYPDLKSQASAEAFNSVLEAMAGFRQVHYGWAQEYIHKRTDDPRGTGGTPYMQWLNQLIGETLNHRK
jgi:indoleamine 2,3-dioxygenase